MIPVAISSHGWQAHPNAVQSLLTKLIESGSEYTVILDADALAREQKLAGDTPPPPLCVHVIDFGTWLRPGLSDNGVLDVHAIRNCGNGLSVDRPVVLDARGRRAELVLSALTHVRYAWYPLDTWHPAFALLCDDVLLLPLSKALADTFYCQPRIATDKEVARTVRHIWRTARTNRWLGSGVGRWQRKVFRYIDRMLNLASNVADKHEQGRKSSIL